MIRCYQCGNMMDEEDACYRCGFSLQDYEGEVTPPEQQEEEECLHSLSFLFMGSCCWDRYSVSTGESYLPQNPGMETWSFD